MWALHDVTLELHAGTVLGLLGENGAGKSTFINLVSGAQPPSEGRIVLDGNAVELNDPREASRLGIVVVHQEPKLANEASIAENIYLPELSEQRALSLIQPQRLVQRAAKHLEELGLADDLPAVTTPAYRLSAAQRQLVTIARAMVSDVKILFLDEPNSSLTPKDTATLWGLVRQMRDRGVAVVVVSHRLVELYEVIDTVAVLRDGRLVGEASAAELPISQAVNLMAGREVSQSGVRSRRREQAGEVVLRLDHVYTRAVKDITLAIRSGEVLGLAGLVGAGRTEIGRAIAGGDPVLAGTITLDGRVEVFRSPQQALAAGVAMTGEERRLAVFPSHDVVFNTAASSWGTLVRFGLVNRARQSALARKWIDRLALKGAPDTPIMSLSGGNQQKALISRSLAARPRVVVFDEPTHGIDVATKAEIARLIRSLADDEGLAVVLISSEVEELVQIADRVAVVRDGRIVIESEGADGLSLVAAALGEPTPDSPADPKDLP